MRVRSLFERLVEMPAAAREAALEALDGEDATCRDEVERLLAAETRAGEFLRAPVLEGAGATRGWTSETAGADRRLPESIGGYRIVSVLGTGGMGTVYLAEDRARGAVRKVALKVGNENIDPAFALLRLSIEGEVLAALDHPNIARFLSGGIDETGRPYLALEHVDGEPIDAFCERAGLGIRERVALVREVCDAVAHAHQRLIVHRDIKPANILVTRAGRPMLLDFGVAKLLGDWAGGGSARSAPTSVLMLTPEYASPEQLRGEIVATSTDIYSLGVVLYELVAGRRPYELEKSTPEEIRRVVCEAEPVRPAAAAQVPDDLVRIIMMALRKEPQRRYSSVEAFSDDLRRFLDGLPVRARPDTLAYRMSRLIRRHSAAAAAAAVAVLALVGATGVSTWQARVAERARERADRRFHDLRRLANTLLVEFDDAIVNLPGATPVREMLVTRALEYLSALERDSGGDADVQRDLAVAFTKVGEVQQRGYELQSGTLEGALTSFRRGLAIRQVIADADPGNQYDQSALADSLWHVAQTLGQMARHPEYLDHAARAVAIRETLLAGAPGHVPFQVGLAHCYQTYGTALLRGRKPEEALAVFERQAAIWTDLAAHDPSEPGHRSYLGAAYRNTGLALAQAARLEDAVAVWRRALALDEALAAEQPASERHRSNLARTCSHIGRTLAQLGRHEEALAMLRRAESLGEALVAVDQNDALVRERLAATYRDLGGALIAAGRAEEARRPLGRALALLEDWAVQQPANAVLTAMLADTYEHLGRVDETGAAALPGERSWRAAQAHYQRSLDLWEALRTSGCLLPVNEDKLAGAAAAVARCRRMTGVRNPDAVPEERLAGPAS